MRKATMMVAALAVIAACSRTDDAANEAAADAAPAASERIAAMPAGQRNAVFIRAIRDSGLECQQVESSERAGEYRGRPVWNARCTGGGNWTIVIDNDVAQILNANEARLVQPGQPQK